MVRFSQNLRSLFEKRNLKLSTVSKNTGIPASTLSEWTGGRLPLISDSLLKLCKYLDVSLDSLICDNELDQSEYVARAEIEIEGKPYSIIIKRGLM